MVFAESLSLEETNKIRISLGLKPLQQDESSQPDVAEENYKKEREKSAQESKARKIWERIDKVRNRKELNSSLKGPTLGDADGELDNTLKWIKRSKKKEAALAKKRQEELESMDKAFQEEYTERDLVGLKVSHDLDAMEDGEVRVLTLKDSRILDNEEDELQNIEMAEDDRVRKNKELKIKRRDYTGYDDDEFVEGKQGMMRSILAKYDDELEGPKETDFRLGDSIKSSRAKAEEEKLVAAAAVNKSLLKIDYAKNLEIADYAKEGDMGFKKPKTKKKRSTRRVLEEDESINNDMEIDAKTIVPRVRDLDVNFVDDDELQAALARSRRAKLQKVKKFTPEQVAQKIEQELAPDRAEGAAEVKSEHDGEDAEVLVFDDTTEFVRAVGLSPTVKKEPKEPTLSVKREGSRAPSEPRQVQPSGDVAMTAGDVPMEELEAGEVRVKDEEDEDQEMQMLNDIEEAILKTEAEEAAGPANGVEFGTTSSEMTFGSGMASTLNILRQQGILAQPTADQEDREKTQLQRDLWLAEQRHRVARRELERIQSRGGNKDQAQREYENRLREQQEARENLEAFKNYKPDVNIVYYDEFGRSLTSKEAWKALSHKFHGKGSGKMKTEKRLKKIAEEKKKEAMISGDTPLSMNRAFQQRQEKVGQAHFILSVGNRGAVPQTSDFHDVQLTKGKHEKTKKRKDGKGERPAVVETGFMTLPAPTANIANGDSPLSGALASSKSASPAPKPGFSRVSAFNVESSAAQVPTERSKVAFEFGAKRKAGEDPPGSPLPKRR